MLLPILIPALLFPQVPLAAPATYGQAPDARIPNAVEVAPGIFVHRSAPNAETYAALKAAGIQKVIDVRRDGEPGASMDEEQTRLALLGIAYYRYAVPVAPPKGDYDRFRAILREAKGMRVLVHCGDGNRASALLCGWLILDRQMAPERALEMAHRNGMRRADTEESLKRMLASYGRAS